MPPPTTPSRGAKKQARHRLKKAQLGLKPLQVFVREEDRKAVRRFVAELNHRHIQTTHQHRDYSLMTDNWTINSLHDALVRDESAGRSGMLFGLLKDETIEATLPIFGDLTVQIVVTGQEVRVSAQICAASAVSDTAAFNDACLRLGPTLPLSNVGLVGTADGETYVIFGQLSARSPLGTVIEELEVLGHNAMVAAAELRPFIN